MHFATVIEDNRFEFSRNRQAIGREAALDGLCVIRTSHAGLPAEQVVRSYKQLTRVEQAFRCPEAADLMVRPVRHRPEDRVRAHLFLCLLAYYVEWHLRRALAPLLLRDEGMEGWQARRDPVAPAKLRPETQPKRNRRRTEDGLPLHSLSTLMQEMGTRCRHQCRLRGDRDAPLVQRLTEPTPLQARALELVRSYPVESN